MAEIPLSRGLVALVDVEDYARLMNYTWHAIMRDERPGWVYAASSARVGGVIKRFYMHQLVANAWPGEVVDHVNRNSLDNRRANLRICKYWQNTVNSRAKIGRSGFRGVSAHPSGTWHVALRHDGKRVNVGTFRDAEEAARAYDEAALKYHGAFASLNFPVRGEP